MIVPPREELPHMLSAVKPLDQFKPDKQCTSGYTNECLECCRARNRAYAREYRLRPEVQARVYEWRTADERKAYQRVKYRDLKEEVIEEYGGCCNCCGEPNLAFLTIDHIFNDGANHRGEGRAVQGAFRFTERSSAKDFRRVDTKFFVTTAIAPSNTIPRVIAMLIHGQRRLMALAKQQTWNNRIAGYGSENPEQLLANPRNWRVHPSEQQSALTGVLESVGVVQNVIVNSRSGHLVDGHLRVSLAIRANQPSIPVTYVDLSDEEEALILATLDPLAALAIADRDQLDHLLREVTTSDAAVMQMLADLATDAGVIPPDFEPVGIDEQGQLDQKQMHTCPECGHEF
jgi:hypothetical protein